MEESRVLQAGKLLADLRAAFAAASHITDLEPLALGLERIVARDASGFVDIYCGDLLSLPDRNGLAAWLGCTREQIPRAGETGSHVDLSGREVILRGCDLASAGATPLEMRAPIAVVVVALALLDAKAREQLALIRRSFLISPILLVGPGFDTATIGDATGRPLSELTPRGLETALSADGDADDMLAAGDLESGRRIALSAAHVAGRQKQRCEAELVVVKDEALLLQSIPVTIDSAGPLVQELAACRKTLDAYVTYMFDEICVKAPLYLDLDDVEKIEGRRGEVVHSVSDAAMQYLRSTTLEGYRQTIGRIGELLHARLASLQMHADQLLENKGLLLRSPAPPTFYPNRLLGDLEATVKGIASPEQQSQRRTFKSQISMTNPLMVVAPLLTAAGFWVTFLPGHTDVTELRKVSFGILGTVGALYLIYSMIAAYPRMRAEQKNDREQARDMLEKSLLGTFAGSAGQAKARAMRAISVHFELVDSWLAQVKSHLGQSHGASRTAMSAMTRETALRTQINDLAGRATTFRAIASTAERGS